MHKMRKASFALFRVLLCMLIIIALPVEIYARGITNTPHSVERAVNKDSATNMPSSEEVKIGTQEATGDMRNKDTNDFESTKDDLNKDDSNKDDSNKDDLNSDDTNKDDSNKKDENNSETSKNDEKEDNIENPQDANSGSNEESSDGTEVITEPQNPEGGLKSENLQELEDADSPIDDMSASAVIGEDAVIVNNFTELKSALVNDNGITTVYLGADIDMRLGGITVNKNKTNMTISGINPEDPDRMIHTLSDYSSATQTDAILISVGSKMTNVLIQDLNVKGRNYFGFVSVLESVGGVYITYERVDYTGSQITYNRRGGARYVDCNITINNIYGGSPTQEVAEATYIEFAGKVKISHYSTTERAFWMDYSAGSISVDPNADVDIYVNSTSLLYNAYINAPLTIGSKAVFRYSGPSRLGEQYFGAFTVEEGAECYIETRNKSDFAVVRLNGDLTVKEGAVFEAVAKTQAAAAVAINQGYSYKFDKPKRVVLFNAGNRAMGWTTNNGQLYIEAQQLNIWDNAGTGTIQDRPKYFWRKREGDNLVIDGVGAPSSKQMISINHNLDASDNMDHLNASTFNVVTGKVISAGELKLTASLTNDTESFVSGMTEAGAEIKVSYTLNGSSAELYTTADESGFYRVDVDPELKDDTDLTVLSSYRYLSTTVTAEKEGELSFVSVPSNLNFKTSILTNQIIKVGRMENNWQIVISDTRLNPARWRLSAKLEQPFQAIGGNAPDMNNSIVFVNNDGLSYPIQTDTDTVIYENVNAPGGQTTVTWEDDKGVLAEIQPGTAYRDVEYTTSIVWNLTDAP